MSYKKIRSLERGVAILQFVNRRGSATAGAIARETGLARPTVYRILSTFVESGLLYRSPSAGKVYRLTEAVARLGGGLDGADPLTSAARAAFATTPATLAWPVYLATWSEEGMVIRETTYGSTLFCTDLGWLGTVAPLWAASTGYAFAAFATPERQAELLRSAPRGVAAELRRIREQGFAEEHDELGRLTGLAVPIGEGDELAGSLATIWEAGADSEASLVERLLPLLRDLRDEIVRRMNESTAPQ